MCGACSYCERLEALDTRKHIVRYRLISHPQARHAGDPVMLPGDAACLGPQWQRLGACGCVLSLSWSSPADQREGAQASNPFPASFMDCVVHMKLRPLTLTPQDSFLEWSATYNTGQASAATPCRCWCLQLREIRHRQLAGFAAGLTGCQVQGAATWAWPPVPAPVPPAASAWSLRQPHGWPA